MNLKKSIQKNLPELTAFFSGKMPTYIYGRKNFTDIPVFCFHAARYPLFERQLQFLKRNNYRTLNADELLERLRDKNYKNKGNEIVLTFDDGLASVWTVAFPLLQKYNFKIISFILPGLTEEGGSTGKTINDPLDKEECLEVTNRDYSDKPLCNWQEIEAMHASGHVDIQSHGMYHMLISISKNIIDFIHPAFDTHNYANIHIPAYADAQYVNNRNFILGHPVYESLPRLSGRNRFMDDPSLRTACAHYVQENGGAEFFKNTAWRDRLIAFVENHRSKHPVPGDFEKPAETHKAMWEELAEAKRIIESRIPDKTVEHFCFPWFIASDTSTELAKQAGYEVVHFGLTPGFKSSHPINHPLYVTRLQEEYLMGLPGIGNGNLIDLLKAKRYQSMSHAQKISASRRKTLA
jgi:peptidoglycan/xylan/chitin deacetylase (PgdA/CDA1 family)